MPVAFETRAEALLSKGETLCCRGWTPLLQGSNLVMVSSVRRLNDPQSTSRGELRATLALRGRALVLRDLRRLRAR